MQLFNCRITFQFIGYNSKRRAAWQKIEQMEENAFNVSRIQNLILPFLVVKICCIIFNFMSTSARKMLIVFSSNSTFSIADNSAAGLGGSISKRRFIFFRWWRDSDIFKNFQRCKGEGKFKITIVRVVVIAGKKHTNIPFSYFVPFSESRGNL